LGPVDTLNPLFARTSAEESASQLLFSRILKYDTTGSLGNDLATDVQVDPTGKIYTVKLRTDARWHDGIQLRADDVAFTVGLLKNPAVRSTITGWSDIEVAAVDESTVTFTLPAVYAAFPHALATFPVVPKHILSKVEPNSIRENDFSNSPIGSGVFKLRFVQDVDVIGGRKIVYMERNNQYYKGISKLEQFQMHVYSTQETIVSALATGEVNAAADLSAANIKQVSAERYDIKSQPTKSGVYALFNTTRDSLKDKAVRQALQIGTDTKAIRSQLPGTVANLELPFIDRQLGEAAPKVPTYDPVLAKKKLDDAGWKLDGTTRKKDGVDLKLMVVTSKDSDFERVLETLVGQWRALGVVVDTQVVDPSDASQQVVQDILQPRNFDVLLYQLTIGADPDVFAYWHSSQTSTSGFNFSNYSNPVSDDALSSARTRLEPSLRNAKYITFAKQWIEDAPAIGLYQSTTNYVSSKNAASFNKKNVFVTPVDRYDDILYWSVGTRPVYKTP
jgi:peptide/nickel transport system substrate-binding protein